jgi:hypothetical protein
MSPPVRQGANFREAAGKQKMEVTVWPANDLIASKSIE